MERVNSKRWLTFRFRDGCGFLFVLHVAQTAHVVVATDNTNGPRRDRDGQYKTAPVVVATDRPNESSAEAENPPQRNSLLTRTRGPCRLLLTSRLREPMPRQLVGPRRGAIFFF